MDEALRLPWLVLIPVAEIVKEINLRVVVVHQVELFVPVVGWLAAPPDGALPSLPRRGPGRRTDTRRRRRCDRCFPGRPAGSLGERRAAEDVGVRRAGEVLAVLCRACPSGVAPTKVAHHVLN